MSVFMPSFTRFSAACDAIKSRAFCGAAFAVEMGHNPDQPGKQDICHSNISQQQSSQLHFCQDALTTTLNAEPQGLPLARSLQKAQAVTFSRGQQSAARLARFATTLTSVTNRVSQVGGLWARLTTLTIMMKPGHAQACSGFCVST